MPNVFRKFRFVRISNVSYLSIKEARTFSKFVYHLKFPLDETDCSGKFLRYFAIYIYIIILYLLAFAIFKIKLSDLIPVLITCVKTSRKPSLFVNARVRKFQLLPTEFLSGFFTNLFYRTFWRLSSRFWHYNDFFLVPFSSLKLYRSFVKMSTAFATFSIPAIVVVMA